MQIVLGVAKWLIVFWLLWPIHKPLHGLNDFGRVTLGIFLFIIFSTKLLYDAVFAGRFRHKDAPGELWHIVGIVLAIALIVGVVILFVGMLLTTLIKSSLAPNSF